MENTATIAQDVACIRQFLRVPMSCRQHLLKNYMAKLTEINDDSVYLL